MDGVPSAGPRYVINFKERKFFYISLKNSGTPGLWDFSFFLSSTFVYEPILFKISMNADIVKTKFFHKSSITSKVIQGHKQ